MSPQSSKTVWMLTALLLTAAGSAAPAAEPQGSFSLQQALSYPYPSALAAAPRGDAVAWVADEQGVPNLWMAAAPGAAPQQLTHYTEDDGQEISHLAFSADGSYLVYVRGGDHDANWPDGLQPDPASGTSKPEMQVWCISLKDGSQKLVGDGDAPA